MQEIKFASRKQYLIGRIFTIKAKKTCRDQITVQAFFTLSELK